MLMVPKIMGNHFVDKEVGTNYTEEYNEGKKVKTEKQNEKTENLPHANK